MFADDCLLYRPINSTEDAHTLRQDFNLLVTWSKIWQMSSNPAKRYILRVTRLHSKSIFNYHISGLVLKSVNDHPYLGIQLSDTLDWNIHVNKVTKKATNNLNFHKRNLSKCSAQVKLIAKLLCQL